MSILISYLNFYRNFRASKAKGQEIAKLPNTEEKVECFSVSLQPLRAELEIINRRYWDILVQTLYNSIMKDITEIESFTQEAVEVKHYCFIFKFTHLSYRY